MTSWCKQARERLRNGLADMGVRSDEEVFALGLRLWRTADKTECGVEFRVLAGLILLLFGDHSVLPDLLGLIRAHWKVIRNPPSGPFLSAIHELLPLPAKIKPPLNENGQQAYYSEEWEIGEWYARNRDKLTWDESIGKYRLQE